MFRRVVSHSILKLFVTESPRFAFRSNEIVAFFHSHSFSFKFASNGITRKGLALTLLVLVAFSVDSAARPHHARKQQPTSEGQASQEAASLEMGSTIEREISGGQRHNYQITLHEGQYAGLIVQQRGIDVVARLLGADGKAAAEFDSEIRNQGTESVELVAETGAVYRLVVEAKGLKEVAGSYQVQFTELRAATERDLSLHEARKLLFESASLGRAGKYDQALAPGTKAVEIRERVLGREHPDVATSIHNLADLYRRKGDYAKAEPLHQRALDIRMKTLGPDNAALAISITYLAELHRLKGEYSQAETLHRRALEIRERVLGPEHSEVGVSVTYLGILYYGKGDYTKAESLLQRGAEIMEKAFGPMHTSVATPINTLGLVYSDLGEYAKAVPLFERALDIWGKGLGLEHPNVAIPLINLARIYRDKGDLDKAEQLYQRALDISMKTRPEHPDVATLLNNLAVVHRDRGDYDKAEQLYLRALEIYQKALGPEHPLVASSLNNLANLHSARGEFDKAGQLHQRVLEIRLKALGPQHRDIAASLTNLASARHRIGDLVEAESLYLRSLDMAEKTVGPEHPLCSHPLEGLATLYVERGDYAKAETLYQRVLKIREKALGPDSPDVGGTFDQLAALYAAKGDLTQAINAQLRGHGITEHNIALNLATGSERQKLIYLASMSKITDRTLSLHVRLAPDNSRACELAATTILQRKGRVLDTLADDLSTLRRRFTAQDQKLLDQLNDTIGQLARLVLNGPQRTTPVEHQKQIEALEEQREKLEGEISRRSAGYYRQSQLVTLALVQSDIPRNAALIEFAVYRPFDPKSIGGQKPYGEARYVAYIIPSQGPAKWTEIGGAKEIDGMVEAFRQALRDPKRKDTRQLARALDQKVMQPIRPLVGDAAQLLISPDGELNLIPFEALVDEQDRYLVERFSCTYLTSGRDLLRLQVKRDSKSAAVVLANPAFGEPELIATTRPNTPKPRPASVAGKRQEAPTRQSVTTGSNLSDVYFAPLGGTAQEAQAIKALFPEASVFTDTQATESSLKRIAAPRILHIATHGFFLTDVPVSPAAGTSRQATRAISANAKVENPLLRSGLALAGANLHKSNDEDGILTALEASGLNLWGTKLVTLSACDTGLGEVKNGEGVYGLRRAFVLAGTETLVMSLWPVSDYVTREMMNGYYKGLKQGQGRGEALRQVQLSMIKRKGRDHPFYWASFIQSGEWANLEGNR